MKIKMKKIYAGPKFSAPVGTICDLPERLAKELIKAEAAEEYRGNKRIGVFIDEEGTVKPLETAAKGKKAKKPAPPNKGKKSEEEAAASKTIDEKEGK